MARPELQEFIAALDHAQEQGAVLTQKMWLDAYRGQPGWSRRNFQRRIKRLKELGVVEPMRNNQRRQQVHYALRIRLKGKQSRPFLADSKQRLRRYEQDLWSAIFPAGLEAAELEARQLAAEQEVALPTPFPPKSRKLIVERGPTWLPVGQSLVHFSVEDLREIQAILDSRSPKRGQRVTS